MITQLIASAALLFGAWMGLFALFKPSWVAGVTGLQARDGHPEGPSEFRGTLGGLFLFQPSGIGHPALEAGSDVGSDHRCSAGCSMVRLRVRTRGFDLSRQRHSDPAKLDLGRI